MESDLAKPMTPERTVLERTSPSMGCLTAIEVILIIRPQCFSFMIGTASRVITIVESRLRRNPRCQSSSSTSRKLIEGGPPALFTRMSTVPKRAADFRTKFFACSMSVTSAGMA